MADEEKNDAGIPAEDTRTRKTVKLKLPVMPPSKIDVEAAAPAAEGDSTQTRKTVKLKPFVPPKMRRPVDLDVAGTAPAVDSNSRKIARPSVPVAAAPETAPNADGDATVKVARVARPAAPVANAFNLPPRQTEGAAAPTVKLKPMTVPAPAAPAPAPAPVAVNAAEEEEEDLDIIVEEESGDCKLTAIWAVAVLALVTVSVVLGCLQLFK